MLTADQVFEALQQHGITESRQMVNRWLREGRIKGERSANRKEGWRVSEEELNKFLDELIPVRVCQAELARLKEEIAKLKAENMDLRKQLSNITKGNVTVDNNRELTLLEIEDMWQDVSQGMAAMPEEIFKKAHSSLIRGLFPGDAEETRLNNGSGKSRPYVCPFTNKRYASAESLVKAAIPYLIGHYRQWWEKQQDV